MLVKICGDWLDFDCFVSRLLVKASVKVVEILASDIVKSEVNFEERIGHRR